MSERKGSAPAARRPLAGRRATIHDLSRLTGVSIGTISRAFNNRPDVSERTRRAVAEAARRIGYQPNPAARRLSRGRSDQIGLLLPDLGNPFYAELVEAIERAARERGLRLLISLHEEKGAVFAEQLRFFGSGEVDGLLVIPPESPRSGVPLAQAMGGVRIVSLKHHPWCGAPSVEVDDFEAGRALGDALWKLGYRRVAYAGCASQAEADGQRRGGLDAAMKARGAALALPFEPALAPVLASGRRLAEAFAALPSAGRPEAVACFSDAIALGLIGGLQQLGLPCPQHVAVAGFDDIPLAGQNLLPLTTVRIPVGQLAEAALAILLDESAAAPPAVRRVPSEVIVRASTPPRAG
jgi:LacI family transcriptional regulator